MYYRVLSRGIGHLGDSETRHLEKKNISLYTFSRTPKTISSLYNKFEVLKFKVCLMVVN